MQSLTQKIKAHALELGFNKVGIARAEILTEEGKHLQEWLNRRYHGTMDWMERNLEKRIDPRNIVPDAKSVISVAMNYYADVPHANSPEIGKISRYAWGDDYHILVTARIQSLVDCIKHEKPDANAKAYVDTGPAMDKAWAVRAGIGWLGKHTNVITKEYGSWVFLGEIISDVDLEYDEPIADFCGSCTACIVACPTHAIVEPYVLDSTKCISYLTIEHKGEIPGELKPKFENWIYGCDICQDVCPWNSFQQQTNEQAFLPREANVAPQLKELQNITKEEFKERFRKSPIKRPKREGFIRNVKAALETLSK
ncbi:MAG: tRNA epoxyqueuosine(34) reductase QueG [Ignavibacteriales bacterium]|nr:tRNA epoxyqueuosine(34) reductase QueG [Ignavibacteriales bacterium]